MPQIRLRTSSTFFSLLLAATFTGCASNPSVPARTSPAEADSAVQNLFDRWHHAAATGDFDAYFGRMTSDAVFLGTDRSERWTRDEFEKFAEPYFVGPTTYGDGAWTYEPRRRAIAFNPAQDTAWIDEDLWNDKYGWCRGTGVALFNRASNQWHIAHYSLAFLVPNEVAAEVTTIGRRADPGFNEN